MTLPALVGFGAASDMLLSGRRVDAAEALRFGLVNQVFAAATLLEQALGYARDIADNVSPRSARIIKRQLRQARSQTQGEALATAFQEVVESLKSDDFAEGVAAFRERRSPQFMGG